MDKTTLVRKDIDEGKRLIEVLEKNGFPILGVFWFYLTEIDEWRFIIVSHLVDKKGPKVTYTMIQKTMKKIPNSNIRLKQISVMSPNNELYKLLKIAIGTGPGISEIRFSHNTINNVYIDDAFIYRIN